MLKIRKIQIPKLSGETERRLYIWLPECYGTDKDARYPVLYMFDGHNVFLDSHATYGKSWGMGDYLKENERPVIVVAVECNHEGNGRLEEYSPVSFDSPAFGKIRGRGKAYMDWLVGTLKPQIDREFRTLPDRKHTAICGSSMGGLMALYAGCCYGHVFQRAACLSPSLWIAPGKLLSMIAKSRVRSDACIYLDYGSEEMGNHFETPEALIAAAHLLLSRRVNVTLRIVPGGNHSEASWQRQIPVFMDCLNLGGKHGDTL